MHMASKRSVAVTVHMTEEDAAALDAFREPLHWSRSTAAMVLISSTLAGNQVKFTVVPPESQPPE